MATQSERIRAAIAARLDAIPNLQVSPYVLTNPSPPCAYIDGGPIEYDETMARGLDMLTFTVTVLVAENADIGAQKRMDEFRAPLGATSIKTVIEGTDRRLSDANGDLGDVQVTKASKPQVYALQILHQSSAAPHLGCDFTVEVEATPS